MSSARRALIAGLGLIGGSIGMALRRRGWHVAYIDPHVSPDDALRAGAADVRAVSLDDDADAIVLATPVNAALELTAAIPDGRLVTSVCSVMAPLRDAADAHSVRFVAGHPLAGSQDRGLAAARGNLFEGKTWFVDRDEALVNEIIAACGARIDRVDAADHDRAMALTSHLPQILSSALAAYLAEHTTANDVRRFAGSGLETFLRLAGSDASVWAPIIAANRENIRPHADAIARLVREIIDGDPSQAFAGANELWNAMTKRDRS